VPKGMVLIVDSTSQGKTIPSKDTFFQSCFEALLFPRAMRKDSPQDRTLCLHSKVGMGER